MEREKERKGNGIKGERRTYTLVKKADLHTERKTDKHTDIHVRTERRMGGYNREEFVEKRVTGYTHALRGLLIDKKK